MDWERASKLLGESLDGKVVKTRTGGGGKQLSYIDHFEAIDGANRIFGHGGWSRHTVLMRQISDRPVAYMAKVRVTVGEVSRDGFGYGADPTGKGDHEKAFKEAETDATKRALMTFGYPLGLALYQKDGMEHVSNGHAEAEVEVEVKTGIHPGDFRRQPGESSMAQSKKDLAILKEEMKAKKTQAEVVKFWSDNAESIKRLHADARWSLFEEMIQFGTDKCQRKLEVELFWSAHQNALGTLKNKQPERAEQLEEYMMNKVTKLGGELINAG